jgi:hypothetical protein
MVNENMLTEREALMRIDAKQMIFFLHPMIDPEALEVVMMMMIMIMMT